MRIIASKEMPLKVGIIGCGAIGSSLAKFIQKELKSQATIAYLFDLDASAVQRTVQKLKLSNQVASLKSIEAVVKKSDFVIEAASPTCAKEVICFTLQHQKPTFLMSGGSLVFDHKLTKKIISGKNKYYFPSGAISGIDGILASREAGLKEVVLTTSKSLKSLQGAPFFDQHPDKLKFRGNKHLIFEGSVNEAIHCFPKNLNVAALLALAGLGPQKTKVKVVAYKKLPHNIHEIEVKSEAGTIKTKVTNLPHPDNPRTSALAVYSAQALLRKLFSPLSLGA